MAAFLKEPGMSSREKDLLRGIPENEAIQQMLSNVKLATPGVDGSAKKKGSGGRGGKRGKGKKR